MSKTEIIVTQEIDTAHTPLRLSESLTQLLSRKGYVPDKKQDESFVWKRRDGKGRLTLNYYTQANSLTLHRSVTTKQTGAPLQRKARHVFNDLQVIVGDLSKAVGHPHVSARIQLEFGVEGEGAEGVFQTVLPTVRNLHSVRHGHVNVDVDMLDKSPKLTRALLTPFNLSGE